MPFYSETKNEISEGMVVARGEKFQSCLRLVDDIHIFMNVLPMPSTIHTKKGGAEGDNALPE